MGQSVIGTGGLAYRSAPITVVSAAYSVVGELQLTGTSPNAIYEAVHALRNNGTGLSYFGFSYTSPGYVVPNTLFFAYVVGGVQQAASVITSSTTSWLHWAVTVSATGNTNFYSALEGFNPSSPSFLVTPGLGTTDQGGGVVSLFDDQTGAGSVSTVIRSARFLMCAKELSQAEVVEQWRQRPPTDAVKAVSYSWLDCSDAATVEDDIGSTNLDWTRDTTGGGFSDQTQAPKEWLAISPAVIQAAQRMGRNTLLRL